MTIDDIFYASIEGRTDDLDNMLAQEDAKDLLNQLIRSEEGEDIICSQFTVVFSILFNMKQNNTFNYTVLYILSKHGMDLNIPVSVHFTNGNTISYPIIKCIIDYPEPLEWTLKNGADPNMMQHNYYPDKLTEENSLLFYAIRNNSVKSVNILLNYNANPDLCNKALLTEENLLQTIPPLYYAVVENKNPDICTELLRYGADPNIVVDFSVTRGGKISLSNYCRRNREWLSVLEEASNRSFNYSDTKSIIVNRQMRNNGLTFYSFNRSNVKEIIPINKKNTGVQPKEYKSSMYYAKYLFRWEIPQLEKDIAFNGFIDSNIIRLQVIQALSEMEYNCGIVDETIAQLNGFDSIVPCFTIVNYDHTNDYFRTIVALQYFEKRDITTVSIFYSGTSTNNYHRNLFEKSDNLAEIIWGGVNYSLNKNALKVEEEYYANILIMLAQVLGSLM